MLFFWKVLCLWDYFTKFSQEGNSYCDENIFLKTPNKNNIPPEQETFNAVTPSLHRNKKYCSIWCKIF